MRLLFIVLGSLAVILLLVFGGSLFDGELRKQDNGSGPVTLTPTLTPTPTPEVEELSAVKWFSKGFALYELGRYEEAIECYDKAIELDPDYADAWKHKGDALYELGRYEEAIECYDKA